MLRLSTPSSPPPPPPRKERPDERDTGLAWLHACRLRAVPAHLFDPKPDWPLVSGARGGVGISRTAGQGRIAPMKPMHPRKRCARIVRECEQFIRDIEWWNANRPAAPPLDCEFERVLLPVAREYLAAWDAHDYGLAGVLAERMA